MTIFTKLCEQKLTYTQVPFLALITLPLAFLSVMLGGGGHAPTLLYLPFLLLYGPLAMVGDLLMIHSMKPVGEFLFVFGSPYLLYLFYGFLFAFFSSRNKNHCRIFLITVLVLHIISSILFLYL